MYFDQKAIISYLSGKKLSSLTKTRDYPFLEWRGEIEDYYIIIRYAEATIYIGLADTEGEAFGNFFLVANGLISSIYDIAALMKFKIPGGYYELS